MHLRGAALVALAAGFACNALTGVGKLSTEAEEPPADGGSDAALLDDGDATADGDAATAATSDAGPSATLPVKDGGPSYCTGLTFYAPYDGTLASSAGDPGSNPEGGTTAVSFPSGVFDRCADFGDAGGPVYYSVASPLGAVYARAQGTVSLWVKPSRLLDAGTEDFKIFKPATTKAGGHYTPAPYVSFNTTGVGLYSSEVSGAPGAAVALADLGSGWHDLAWNHLIGTWTASPPSLTFSFNGGKAVSNGAPWSEIPLKTPVLFRVGTEAVGLDMAVDDLAVWNRVLSADELADFYASTTSLGSSCGL